ncbi:eukaryotic mediator 12 subunit domain-containing protein [Ditylenchus destructor]|uniref:Eukaryotic mediator 12 subunit domain-containing protein n=1 Tax=Ditylenchus destructor TaxID=166010 RepID=A0AAD4NJX6_9BILA|nr:eukaryotic mediator 12 subunit domain-containing protein [Ditylenchus destructor]
MPSHTINSWHNQSPEKRPLRRHKVNSVGGSSTQESPRLVPIGHPDVYPQDPKQEEDKMSNDRLANGYRVSVPSIEYETLIKNSKFEKPEDTFVRSAKWVFQVLAKKNEQNVIALDKKKVKESTFPGFSASSTKSKEYQKFFEDLARGKSLQSLTKRFPYFKRKDDCMEHIYLYKVPLIRALWFFKMTQVSHNTIPVPQNKQKKTALEQYSADQTKLFTKYLRDMLKRFNDSPQPETLPAYQRWPYFICLFKHAFEEGILDRNDFLMDICEILNDAVNYHLDKPQIFRMLIVFLSQFVDVIVQNVFLARKVAYCVSTRLRIYKRDYERKKGALSNASDCFSDLVHCQHHRTAIMTMLGLLHAIVIDCPVALVWNNFDLQDLPQQLCGSPLDLLPCSPDVLTQHLPKSASIIDDMLRLRISEIKKRSSGVENRWSLAPNNQSGFESAVDVCLNTLAALDTINLGSPKALLTLYRNIFCTEPVDKIQHDLLIRLRLLLKWAITCEREGTHRAIVVCNLLAMRKRHCRGTAFGSYQLQDVLVDYLNREAPTLDSPHFHKEYDNLVHLFSELQRFGLFNHDAYVRALMRCGQFSYQEPVLVRLRNYLNSSDPNQTSSNNQGNSQSTNPPFTHDSNLSSVKNEPTPAKMEVEPPAIISFIPNTTTSTPAPSFSSQHHGSHSSVSNRPNSATGSSEAEEASLMPLQLPADQPTMLSKPIEMSTHERLLIQLPIDQSERYRDACNQRAILLYGITDERETARQELRKVALQICRIWQRKVNVEFFHNSKEVRFKRRVTPEIISEALAKFKSQTYYDQVVICGWCIDSFMEMFKDFFNCNALILPTSECLEILCSMMENCQNYQGIVTLTLELIPQLIYLERVLATFHSDCMPGTIASQLAYVLAGCLADHFHYFLYSKEASNIVNGLYRLIEKELRAVGYPITGWARAIAAFIYHARSELLGAQLNDQPLLGSIDEFRKIFPESGAALSPDDLKYNNLLLTDFLKEPRRFYCYHSYKLHLPSIEDAHTRYSFVVNAFAAAKNCKNDYDRLAELSNICGHVSVQKPMAGEWCVAIQELCYSSVSKSGYSHLIREINVNDLSIHYPLSTFVVLLASKYCFSMHALIMRLLNNILVPIIKTENLSNNAIEGSEMGLCLAMEIIASIVCGTDTPFLLNTGTDIPMTIDKGNNKKILGPRNCDLRALKIAHIRELDICIFPLLSAVAIFMDMLMKRTNERNGNSPRLRLLLSIVKSSLLAMCEQEWVVNRVYRICEYQRDLDSFNTARLRKTPESIGQLLMRIALRRRCERETKQELMDITLAHDESKRYLLDKLFSSLTIWNMRATFYDLKLMIKEISPDTPQKASNQAVQIQQAMFANRFFTEVGRSCKELFANCRPEDNSFERSSFTPESFRFRQINCYWLLSPLIAACPKPDNVPQAMPNQMTVTVKARFLDEAASILDPTNNDNGLMSCAQLLAQQPFVNLILTCIRGEEIDKLNSSLLSFIQGIIADTKENPALPFERKFAPMREALLLRLNLIGGVFDSLLHNNGNGTESWAVSLFQLMFYEIISPDRDSEYFDVCFDMLSNLVHSMMSASNSQSAYNGWVRKIRRELGERIIPPELNCLAQLLPVPKSKAELTAWDSFSASNSPQKTSTTSKSGNNSNNIANNSQGQSNTPQAKLVAKQLMRLLYHNHYTEFPYPGFVGSEQLRFGKDMFLSGPAVDYIWPQTSTDPLFSSAHNAAQIPQSTPSTASTTPRSQGIMQPGSSSSTSQHLQQVFPPSSTSANLTQSSIQPQLSSMLHQAPGQPPQPKTEFNVGAAPRHPAPSMFENMPGNLNHPQQGAGTSLPPQHPSFLQQQQPQAGGLQHHPQQPFFSGSSQPNPIGHSFNSQQSGSMNPLMMGQQGTSGQGMTAAMVSLLSESHRSGSSTPTMPPGLGPATTSSPNTSQRGVGRGGGRRKNPASGLSTTTTSGRGQKRKKMEMAASSAPRTAPHQAPQLGMPPGMGMPGMMSDMQMQLGGPHHSQMGSMGPSGQQQFHQQQSRSKKLQPPMNMRQGPTSMPKFTGQIGNDMAMAHHQQQMMMNPLHQQQQQQIPSQMHGGGFPSQQANDSKQYVHQKLLQRINAQQQQQGGGNMGGGGSGGSMQM